SGIPYSNPRRSTMEIKGKVAVITGAGSGIGQAAAIELVNRGVSALGLADLNPAVEQVAAALRDMRKGDIKVHTYIGNTTDSAFRKSVYDQVQQHLGICSICVPAAGITRDALAVKIDKATGKASIYAEELFRQVVEVNLIAPV